jgi:hypothetical protein
LPSYAIRYQDPRQPGESGVAIVFNQSQIEAERTRLESGGYIVIEILSSPALALDGGLGVDFDPANRPTASGPPFA